MASKKKPITFGLSDKELKTIKNRKTAGIIIKAAELARRQRQFNVGDVLVSYTTDTEGKIHYEMMPSSSVKQKYVVVHKDDNELVYCKKVLVTGQLGVGVELICDQKWRTEEYTLDPEQADHIILGDENEEFDPFAAAKKLRKHKDAIKRHNETIVVPTKDKPEVRAFLKEITEKFGTESTVKIWKMNGWSDTNPEELTVTSAKEEPIDKISRNQNYWGQGKPLVDQWYVDEGFATKFTIKTKSNRSWGTTELLEPSMQYRGYLYFFTKPKTYAEEE